MHELSIVSSIVDLVEEEVQNRKANKVESITLEIGELAGIEWDSFDFAWGPATKRSVLEHAERIIKHVPAIALCKSCGNKFEKKEPYDPCPECYTFLHELESGKELKIKSLVIS